MIGPRISSRDTSGLRISGLETPGWKLPSRKMSGQWKSDGESPGQQMLVEEMVGP
jgi:hypothetical protein